jgi:methyltransferase (TIGR00027 family)
VKANEASSTAKVIAASTIALASEPCNAALVAPGAAELCRAFLSGRLGDRWLAWSAAHPLTRWLWRRVEALTLPGIVAHYWYRKRWIEARCRSAIDEGFERVVVLGAGLDTLAFRLAREFAQLDVIEIDHPATQAAKRRCLHGDAMPPLNLRLAALDLAAAPLGPALPDDDRATVVVMEGVLMYLPAADIDALFDTLRRMPARRLRIVFSFMTRWPDGGTGFRPRSWLIERWLAWRGEPFSWALSPDAMPAYLHAHGLRLLELATTRQLAPVAAALEGENLVACEPAPAAYVVAP